MGQLHGKINWCKCNGNICTKTKKKTDRIIILILAFAFVIVFIIGNEIRFLTQKHYSEMIATDTMSEDHRIWMELMALRMKRRRRNLENKCNLLNLNVRKNDSLHKPNEWEFLINRPFRLVWCNVFKAASTSWLHNFNILAGYKKEFLQNTKIAPLELARRKYPRPTLKDLEEALNDSTSFLIVRHPFERLLSAYRNKLEFPIPNSYNHKLGYHIAMKNRNNNKGRNRQMIPYEKRVRKAPTFFQFVEFLIQLHQKGKRLDEHWAPITTFCTPCQIRFDVIMKFETFQEDQTYLIYRKDLQNRIKAEWKNPTKGKNSINLLRKYYTQLNATLIYQLYNMYRYDFYLFDYTIDNYLKYLDGISIPGA